LEDWKWFCSLTYPPHSVSLNMVKLSPEGYQNLGKLQILIEMHVQLNARAWQCLMLMVIEQGYMNRGEGYWKC